MIKDILNLQGNTIELLEKGHQIYLETKKGMRLRVELMEVSPTTVNTEKEK